MATNFPKTKRFIFVIALLLTITSVKSVNMESNTEEYSKKLGVFAMNVYERLALLKPNENMVFSPFSIQTCAAMARLGAEGETAAELDRGLNLPSQDLATISQTFHDILEVYEKSEILKIANKIYVMRGYPVQDDYNELLTKNFFTIAEEINFANNVEAANSINKWVETKTNNLIKDLIPASALDMGTRLVLLNAIHFKGEWVHPFPKRSTHEDDFYLNDVDKVKVQMMSVKERFRYAELPELNARALEMKYKNSNLSMLIILPNSRTGLKELEQKLQCFDLSEIAGKMHNTQVIVKMPKFKAEFQVELNDVFKQLGMSRMFSGQAEFGKMLEADEPLQVSKVIHKAFIDVNEEGTEAAAATVCSVRKKRSAPFCMEFIATHPFVYVISHATNSTPDMSADNEAATSTPLPIFMGTVATLNESTVPEQLHQEL